MYYSHKINIYTYKSYIQSVAAPLVDANQLPLPRL